MPVFELRREKIPSQEGPLREIPLQDIVPNPFQPRRTFDEKSIAELADSIAQVGLLQPLIVRPAGERTYELVAGERRLRAVKRLGMERVCCIVREAVYDERSALMALVENLQREDLHYFEEAQCYSFLLQSFDFTQEELAKKIGRSQSAIANKLRLLKLPPVVKKGLQESGLSERHARALLKLPDEAAQAEALAKAAAKGLSVSETERLVERMLESKPEDKPHPTIVRLVRDYRLFMNSINMAVEQLREAGFLVKIEQNDQENGVEIGIRVSKPK